LALLAVFLALPTCAHVTPVVKDCGAETVAGLLGAVNNALATGDYEAELAKLIGQFGECAIVAAVKQIAGDSAVNAQVDTLEAQKQQRAKAWLAAHGG